MYKSKIHKWGLDKKHKEREARAILHMHARRRGKATRIRLRGQSVNINNVQAYFKRKRIAIEDVLSSEAVAIPGLVCETPVVSPKPMPRRLPSSRSAQPDGDIISRVQSLAMRASPQRLESPDSFKTAELLFADVREYVLVSFGTGCWISHGPNVYCQSRRESFAKNDAHELHYDMMSACELFDMKQPAEAIRKVSEGFAYIKSIVENHSLAALPYLIQSIAMLLAKKFKPIVLMLCNQLSSMAAIVGPKNDWINFFFRSIFSRIRSLAHNDEANDYLLAALRSSIDSHEKVLGPFHLQTLRITSMLTRMMSYLHGPECVVGPLRALYESFERQQGPGTAQSLRILLELVDVYIHCGQFQAAEINAQKAVEQATPLIQSSRSGTNLSLLYKVYSKISYLQALREDFFQAEINSQMAEALAQELRGQDGWRVMPLQRTGTLPIA